jgi:hypothetical protein
VPCSGAWIILDAVGGATIGHSRSSRGIAVAGGHRVPCSGAWIILGAVGGAIELAIQKAACFQCKVSIC